MDSERTKKKKLIKKKILTLMSNSVFKKQRNVRRHRDIELVTNEARSNYLVIRNYLVSYNNFFSENLLAKEMTKQQQQQQQQKTHTNIHE